MSIIWFLIICGAFGYEIEIKDTALIALSIFYVGDCILWKGSSK